MENPKIGSYLTISCLKINATCYSYKSENVIKQLSSEATDQKISNKIREGCSAALSKSKGVVPFTIFEKLLEDKNPHIRRNAVKGLDRFSTSRVKDLLLKYVNDENRGVQYEVIKILIVFKLRLEFALYPLKSVSEAGFFMKRYEF